MDVPAGAGAALPHVAAAGSNALLSWVEPRETGHALLFAQWDGTGWTAPLTVAEGSDWFVNWADFPSVVALGNGDLAAHWLQRSGPGTYAYDVMVSQSRDGGATWSDPVRPHADGTPTEHGFVSMFPVHDGLGVVWLDGRSYAAHDDKPATNEMALRFTTLGGASGSVESVIDERVCDCCQTAVAMTRSGPLIAYRDRSHAEVRDISVSRLVAGTWTEPQTLHADNWEIDACPVNGPQADAHDSSVAVAWFTAAGDTPVVNVAFSGDDGATFAAPVRVDDGNPLGRVDVLLLDGDRALVLWLERSADAGVVAARIVTRDGQVGETAVIGETLAQRPSGFPRMGRFGDAVLLAWTEPGDTSRVRAAVLDIGSLRH
ncbi:MAG: exo-alpha-sialidase [Gemmatimonadetes bacterium]|nr:exo-alpha-sialidase [Gemmatimonadota bacterium]